MFRTTRLNPILRAVGFVVSLALASHALAEPPQWTIFRPTNTGVLGDWSHTVWVDDQDRPWIASYNPFKELGGMSRKNADGTWTVVTNDVGDGLSNISSPRFNHIAQAPNGVLWIGTYDSLLRYDPAHPSGNSSLQRYDIFNSPLSNGRLYDVAVAPDGTVWCAVLNINNAFQGGLARFNPATNAWTVWSSATTTMPWASVCPNCSGVASIEIQSDPKGDGYTVWFHGDGFGFGDLGMVSYRDGAFTWYGQPSSIPAGAPITPTGLFNARSSNDQNEVLMRTNQGFAKRSPAGTYTLVPSPPISSVNLSVMVPLNNGRYGAASYLGDVYLFSGGSWQYLGNWNGNHTYSMDEESNGALWVSGIGGSARYFNGQWQRYRVSNTGPLGYFQEAIAFGADGTVYLGDNGGPGMGGFEMFDGTHWTCVNNFNYGLGPAWGLPSDDVASMCMRSNGHLALAPRGLQGLLDWNGSSYTTMIPHGFEVGHVVEDALGRLWGGEIQGQALYRAGGAGGGGPGQFAIYTSSNSPMFALEIVEIVSDPTSPGYVWCATALGLMHTNGEQWQLYPKEMLGLSEGLAGGISCFDRASDGTLWVGSYEGLIHFNPITLQHTHYTAGSTGGGLVSSEIRRVKIAPDQSVWVATMDWTWPYPGGLSHLQGTTWTTYIQGSSPLLHNQNGFLASRAVQGGYELWVGMLSEGVARITVATTAPTPGDVNGDGQVNVGDLLAVIGAWGPCPISPAPCPADIAPPGAPDGVVGVSDLLLVIANWN